MIGAAIGKDKDRLWCILQDEKMFYIGGYKALNMTAPDSGLAHCMKSTDNGKIKISYDISDCSPLSEEVKHFSADEIVSIVKTLTQSVLTINSNGMMSLQSTVLDLDKVFVSGSRSSGYKTHLIYIPLAVHDTMSRDAGIENYFNFLRELLKASGKTTIDPELRPLSMAVENSRDSLDRFYEQLSQMASFSGNSQPFYYSGLERSVPTPQTYEAPAISAPKAPKGKISGRMIAVLVVQLVIAAFGILLFLLIGPLAVAALLLMDAIAVVVIFTVGTTPKKQSGNLIQPYNCGQGEDPDATVEMDSFSPTIRLVGQNTPMMVKFNIVKPVFTIGRSAECDGVIPDALKKISGHHCTVITEGDKIFIKDDYASGQRIGSRNGTFINGSGNRIEPMQKARIQINDTVQLANYRFKVEHL